MSSQAHEATQIVVRAFRSEDAPALTDIRHQPEVMRYTPSMPSERALDYQARWGANDHVMVAEVDGRVVGFAGLHIRERKQRHSAWLGIAVHDEFARRGVGRALMHALVELADSSIGLVRVDLEADVRNTRAIEMYRRFGFVEEGRLRRAYFSDGEYVDAVLMARVR